ncbi:MAG TPA: aminoglycoside phosphotransferase [Streptosporangiaceae bacterium]|nr:aminoglycoside phosphotransferase [Streptosporangiaceae bacterium]
MSNGSLTDLLAAWLPRQRWFAGGGAGIRNLTMSSDVTLAAGDPELRHLLADVSIGEETVRYQVPVGLRTALPPGLRPARIGTAPDGRIAYDGMADPELAAVLLRGIASHRQAGPLRFAAQPDPEIDQAAAGRTLPALASNTSVVFGDQAILKIFRRPFQGHHPDLEIPARLASSGSKLVAAPLGWIELPAGAAHQTDATATVAAHQTDAAATGLPGLPDGDSTVLAILSEFFPAATDGWSLAAASLDARPPDFTAQAHLLGQVTARLHAELAAAFGTSPQPRLALAELATTMAAELTRAIEIVPRLREYEQRIRASYAELDRLDAPVTIQRIHGDYHLAQVLSTERGWVILDFEGEPSVPLARRRAFAPPLRDVAGMLRSFDYAGRHQVLRRPADQRLKVTAADWIRRCQDAFLAGYAEAERADPGLHGPLLRALIFQKAVYEAVYEARHRPGWLPIPLGAIAEAAYDSDR